MHTGARPCTIRDFMLKPHTRQCTPSSRPRCLMLPGLRWTVTTTTDSSSIAGCAQQPGGVFKPGVYHSCRRCFLAEQPGPPHSPPVPSPHGHKQIFPDMRTCPVIAHAGCSSHSCQARACTQHRAQMLSPLILTMSCHMSVAREPILQLVKLRLREGKSVARGHTASHQQG